MRTGNHTDQKGRIFVVDVPLNCTDVALAPIIGPPVFEEDILDLDVDAILTRLHNELMARGIVTARDTVKPGAPKAITDAIRAATSAIISVSDVIAAYEEED